MTPAERFAVALAKLAEVFRIEVTPTLVESYWEAVKEFPSDALDAGARRLIRESRFFPRPLEWIEAAEDFLRERLSQEQARRLRLAQSTEPPLRAEDVKRLVAELSEKLGWPSERAEP